MTDIGSARSQALDAVADKIARSLFAASAKLLAENIEEDYGSVVDAWMAACPDLDPVRIADEVLSGDEPPEPSPRCPVCGSPPSSVSMVNVSDGPFLKQIVGTLHCPNSGRADHD